MDPTAQIKHLEFIQAAIARMAANSFLLRGWGMGVIAALLALESKGGLTRISPLALFILFAFWMLDGFYLTQERRFRCLYDLVRESTEDMKFTMDVSLAQHLPHYAGAWASLTVYWFWGVLFLAVLFAWIYYP